MMRKRTTQKAADSPLLDWESLRIFLAVARDGSARRAADQLGTHYTSITRRLKVFEAEVGGRLFDKGPGGYVLTQLGGSVLQHVEAMESEALAVGRRLLGADERIQGTLRVTTTTTLAAYLLVEEFKAFTKEYPGIDLRIQTGYAFADLSRGEAEVTIRASNAPGDRLVGRRFATYHQSVYATPEYITLHPPDTDGSGCVWMDWVTDEVFRRRAKRSEFPLVKHYAQIEDEVLLLEAAKAGMGMATMPCFYADKAHELVRVSRRAPEPVLGIWLLTHPDLSRNARVRCFTDYFSAALKGKRGQLEGKAT